MSTVVNTNTAALKGIASLGRISKALNDSLEKLSSGYKVNKGADDASGLAIASTMSAQIGGVRQAISNAGDGISMIQTADGAMAETTNILLRMRDLAVKSANGATLTAADRTNLQTEFSALVLEISAKVTRVTFNTKGILSGTSVKNAPIHVGPGTNDSFKITITSQTVAALKVNGQTLTTTAGATTAITKVDSALAIVGNTRARLGTVQRRLNHIINDLTTQDVNLSASRSRILDTDFASEISNFTKLQILQQTGTAVLAQANSSPQSVIQLLG